MTQACETFAREGQLHLMLVLIALDLALGVIAALKLGTFVLAYVSDFLRADVLFKVVPWFALWLGDRLTRGADVAAGVGLGAFANAAYGFALAALVGSLASSVRDLGLPAGTLTAVDALAGHDPRSPVSVRVDKT